LNKKKLISLTLAASMLLSYGTGRMEVSAAQNDLNSHWAAPAIQKWKGYSVINGFSDGSMRPDQPITRAELVSMLNRIMNYQKPAKNIYEDCDDSSWYAKSILGAVAAGIIYGDGVNLNPDAQVSRQQTAVIMAKVLELNVLDSGKTHFEDDSSIADFARPSVKAMKAAGLMKGDEHNRFNPDNTITRGEIAQVLSNAFDVIVPAEQNSTKPQVGSVVLQGNNANLNGQHVKGDVIVAEGVADGEVTLTNVTVDGRIIVRGGGKNSVHLNGTKVGSVVMDKNGSAVRLDIAESSSVNHVIVADGISDVIVDGNASAITVNGAGASLNITGKVENLQLAAGAKGAKLNIAQTSAVGNIVISAPQTQLNISGTVSALETASSADGTKVMTTSTAKIAAVTANASNTIISGEGKVASVDIKAQNVKVGTAGTIVKTVQGTSSVTTGQSNAPSGGSGSSGSSGNSGGSVNPGGSGNSGGSVETPVSASLVNEAQTGVKDLGWCQYVALSFKKGYNKDNCTIVVDGIDITSAVTNVTDNGSLAKWELTGLNPSKLTIASKANPAKAQVVLLNNNSTSAKPIVVKQTAPAYILTHAAIPTWDYHLTNYDDNGIARIRPSKTTFSTDTVASATIKSYSADADLKKDESSVYGVSGKIEILFNYNTEETKEWFDSIADSGALALVSYDENKSTLNSSLSYTKTTDIRNRYNVGVLTIPIGQNNFYSNGRYNIRVISAGHKTAIVPIHVVKETAPSMKLNEAADIVSGQNIHFKVSNMTYGIQVPIETVTLTDPSGETKTLEKITDWYLLGELFVLYNDENSTGARNNIPSNGVYTVTVYSNGFKTMSKKFEVTGGSAPKTFAAKYYALEAVSSASGSTGGGNSSGGSGGMRMSADLLFNADLLINALIMEKVGVSNTYAEAIASRWKYDVSGYDAVYSEDGTTFYTWTGYNDAVRGAKLNGKYMSFADYTNSGNAEITPNRPYAVKEILEDNLLGETQYGGSYKGQTAPPMKLDGGASQVTEGHDAALTGADAQYLSSINEVFVNGNWQALPANKYSADTSSGKLTIKSSSLKLGDNTIEIKATGYKSCTLSIRYQKILENVTLSLVSENHQVKQDVAININNSTGDFLNNLQRVTVNGKNVLTKEAGGSSMNDWYEADISKITLKAGLFTKAGPYTVVLNSQYYGEKSISFTISSSDQGGTTTPTEPSEAPTVAAFTKEAPFYYDPHYRVSFNLTGDSLKKYLEAITAVNVGTVKYEKSQFFPKAVAKFMLSSNETYGGLSYLDLTSDGFSTSESTTVVITATGYKAMTFTVDKDGRLPSDTGGSENPGGDPTDKDVPGVVALEKSSIPYGDDAKIVLGSYADQAYYHGFTGIKVDGGEMVTASALGVTTWSYHFIVKGLAVGTHEIILFSEGYKEKALTLTVTKASVPSNIKIIDGSGQEISAPSVSANDVIMISLGSVSQNAYKDSGVKIIINGGTATAAEASEKTFGYSKHLVLELPTSNLNVGTNTITLTSDSYQDKSFTINVRSADEKLEVPGYVQLDKASIEFGSSVGITLATFSDKNYLKALTSITMDDVEKERSTLGLSDYSYSFTVSGLEVGTHTIVLHANNYKDKSLTVTVTKKNPPLVVRLIVEGSAVSQSSIAQKSGMPVKIVLGDSWQATYKNGLKSVSVNDKVVPAPLPIASETVSYSDSYVLTLPADCFEKGANKIILSSEGYEDKIFTINVTD
jgi:uncharacterized protein YegP (UPF0339 family)